MHTVNSTVRYVQDLNLYHFHLYVQLLDDEISSR